MFESVRLIVVDYVALIEELWYCRLAPRWDRSRLYSCSSCAPALSRAGHYWQNWKQQCAHWLPHAALTRKMAGLVLKQT